jgi:hypothetical protein
MTVLRSISRKEGRLAFGVNKEERFVIKTVFLRDITEHHGFAVKSESG